MPRHLPAIPTVFIVAVVLIAAWGNSYQSCLRSEHVRASLRITYQASALRASERATHETGAVQELDLRAETAAVQALARVSHLVCLAPLPPT